MQVQVAMLNVECHISINKDGNNFLGAARVALLHEISRGGSLTAAAKKQKISYQHAWNMIDEINRLAPNPLVVLQRGGANGGGAQLSAYGINILREYEQIEAHVNKLIAQINVEINF